MLSSDNLAKSRKMENTLVCLRMRWKLVPSLVLAFLLEAFMGRCIYTWLMVAFLFTTLFHSDLEQFPSLPLTVASIHIQLSTKCRYEGMIYYS